MLRRLLNYRRVTMFTASHASIIRRRVGVFALVRYHMYMLVMTYRQHSHD